MPQSMLTPREQTIEKINRVKKELQTAGTIHARELKQHLRFLERELQDYDRFQEQATIKKARHSRF